MQDVTPFLFISQSTHIPSSIIYSLHIVYKKLNQWNHLVFSDFFHSPKEIITCLIGTSNLAMTKH